MSQPRQQASNQQFYVALGVMAALVLLCIGAFTYVAGMVAQKIPETEPTRTPLPPPVVSIREIKGQAELSTVEYSTVTEVYNETAAEGLVDEFFGNKEQLLMLVYGDINAGFNLEKLTEDNLWTDGEQARLILPAPEILNSSINFDRTHIVFYENDLILDSNNPNLQGEALKRAKSAIKEAALQDGILDRANEHGKLYFENFLRSLGFTDVEVVVDAQIFNE